MPLRPQDVVVLLKLALARDSAPTYAQLASQLHMSSSEVHASVKRARAARLVDPDTKSTRVNRGALMEFLIHGVKYAFPAVRGALTRGIPTSYAAPPLAASIRQSDDPPPVWPHPEGKTRGYELQPLARRVAEAAMADPELHEVLALVDAIRDGRSRERTIAERELTLRLKEEATLA